VGKQRIPRAILEKPGRLTSEELAEIRKYPLYGFDMLGQCSACPEVVKAVALQHSERLDGSGYPARRDRGALHPYSLITAVADSFDAMTAERTYRKAISPHQVLQELYAARERLYDRDAVCALIKLIGVYPVGTRVILSTGERAVVVAPNPHDTVRPVVEVNRDPRGRSLISPYRIALAEGSCSILRTEG
jgi:HD-GYP domain-containing protein (c-di-GMP phosphodiesterase class II)